jgi:hypothetical protein
MADPQIKMIVSTDLLDTVGAVNDTVPRKTFITETTAPIVLKTDQVVGTTHEQIYAGDVPDGCHLQIHNQHATATVSVGRDVSTVFEEDFTIKAGDPPIVIPRVTDISDWYLKSSVASTPVRVVLVKIVDPA